MKRIILGILVILSIFTVVGSVAAADNNISTVDDVESQVIQFNECSIEQTADNAIVFENDNPSTINGVFVNNTPETSITINTDEKPVPAKENLSISATVDSITVDETAVIIVTGFEDATGYVIAEIGDINSVAPIVGGTATFVIHGLIENATAA